MYNKFQTCSYAIDVLWTNRYNLHIIKTIFVHLRRCNLIYIKELHDGNTIYYDLEITNNEETISHKTIYYRSTIKEKDGFAYLMLYDLDMAPLKNVFDFLNYGISSQSINSRIKALQALKLLYYYQTIISLYIDNFSYI